MAQPLTIISNAQKHKIDGDQPWYHLCQVDMPDGATHIYLAKNPEDVVYRGVTYVAFAFDIDEIVDKSTGEITSVQLWISNVTRLLMPYLEQYEGGVGASVTLRVVSAADLAGDPSLEVTFDVIDSVADAQRVTFTLGLENPLRRAFPKFSYLKDFCMWQFKSAQCGYAGAAATCSHHLNDADGCRAKANQRRFGGFPAIDSQGYLFASPQ